MTTDTVSSIPTFYGGVNLRSRMEAQCAVLFDKLGWGWEYEKYSLMLPSGLTYIPDFWIEDHWLLVECRGYHSERGDRQIEEMSELFLNSPYYSSPCPQLETPDDNGEFYSYLVIGPETVRLYRRPENTPGRGVQPIFHKCPHGYWRIPNMPDACGVRDCHLIDTVSAMALTVKSGKLYANGVPIEDFSTEGRR